MSTTNISATAAVAVAVAAPQEKLEDDAMDPTKESSMCWKWQHEENKKRRRREQEQKRDGINDSTTSTSITTGVVCRADAIATECRNRLIESIRKIAAEIEQTSSASAVKTNQATGTPTHRKLGLLLSGGVDSSAILEAAASIDVRFAAAVTVVIMEDEGDTNTNTNSDNSRRPPEDELYGTEAARLYNNKDTNPQMKHSLVRLSPAQLIEGYSRPTIRTLALWGYMDTRNSLIISAAFHEASELGLTDVIVGDNADELFGGSYDSYFDEKYAKDAAGWKLRRDGMADLPFVTHKLAASYNNITVHAPFMDPHYVEWALRETTRNDCVITAKHNHSTCSIQSKFGEPYEMHHNCGKIPLREAFSTVASWRRMDWIFRGSVAAAAEGKRNILVDYYNNHSVISDIEFQSELKDYQHRHGITLKSKEHLYNIRIYQSIFGGEQGLVHPTKERYPIGDRRGCISCCFEIGDEQFCHLCDEYPAQHPV